MKVKVKVKRRRYGRPRETFENDAACHAARREFAAKVKIILRRTIDNCGKKSTS